MALMGELTGQGRVVGGYLVNGTVVASKDGLTVQMMVKRHKLTRESVSTWEELKVEKGAAKVISSVAGTILPRGIGKTVGATLSASVSLGHTVKVLWVGGEQSVIELPEKLFMILKNMLAEIEVKNEVDGLTGPPEVRTSLTEQLVDLASSVIPNRNNGEDCAVDSTQGASQSAPQPDVIEQLERLSTLRNQGVLSEDEFAILKADLLGKS